MAARDGGRARTTTQTWAPALLAVATVAVVAVFFAALRTPTVPLPRGAEPLPVFSAEFDSGPLGEPWAVETPWHKQYTTGELQYYEAANVSFPPGVLRITTEQQQVSGEPDGKVYDYTSAMISTGSRADEGGTSRAEFTYGYFEMRAKLPKGRGVFPAFWLTNDHDAEIDVVEVLGHDPRTMYMSLHSGSGEAHRDQREQYTGADLSAGFHTFGVDWQPTYVRYYLDGRELAEFDSDVPHTPLWIVANTAVGGGWPGDPDGTAVFPQYHDIDYIRVWKTRPASASSP